VPEGNNCNGEQKIPEKVRTYIKKKERRVWRTRSKSEKRSCIGTGNPPPLHGYDSKLLRMPPITAAIEIPLTPVSSHHHWGADHLKTLIKQILCERKDHVINAKVKGNLYKCNEGLHLSGYTG
jgi:hypothetical protein